MSDLRETYGLLWSRLEDPVPSSGFATEKDKLFFMERDLDRKIQLLMVATLIELTEKIKP